MNQVNSAQSSFENGLFLSDCYGILFHVNYSICSNNIFIIIIEELDLIKSIFIILSYKINL